MVVEAEGFDLSAGTKPLLRNAELVLERGEHVVIGPNGSGKSTLLEAIVNGEVGRIGHGVQLAFPRSTRSSSTSAAACSSARWARPACSAPRRRRCSAASSSPAGTTTTSRSSPSRAASGADSRSRSSSPRAPLPRPRRADEPPRPREPGGPRARSRRSRARCCSSRTTGPCSTPSPSGSSRSSAAPPLLRRRLGRLRAIRAGEEAPPLGRRRSGRRSRGRAAEEAEAEQLELVERTIQERELELADLERRLAEDWGVDLLAAHRATATGSGAARALGGSCSSRPSRCDDPAVRRRRHRVQAMTLSARTLPGGAALVRRGRRGASRRRVRLSRLSHPRPRARRGPRRRHVQSAAAVAPLRSAPRQRTHVALPDRAHRARLVRAEERRQRREERAAAPERVDVAFGEGLAPDLDRAPSPSPPASAR